MNLPLFSHWLIRNLSWWFHFHTCLFWELFLVAIWLPYLLLLQRRTNWIVQRNLIRIQRILALEALLNVSFSFYSKLCQNLPTNTYLTFLHFIKPVFRTCSQKKTERLLGLTKMDFFYKYCISIWQVKSFLIKKRSQLVQYCEAKNMLSKKWKLKKKDYINVAIGFFVRIYQPQTWMA